MTNSHTNESMTHECCLCASKAHAKPAPLRTAQWITHDGFAPAHVRCASSVHPGNRKQSSIVKTGNDEFDFVAVKVKGVSCCRCFFAVGERRFVRAGCRSQLETTQNPKFERSDKHFFENRKFNNPTRTRFFARKKTSRSRTLFVLSLRGACLFSLSLQGPRFVFAVVPGALLFFLFPLPFWGRTWGGANKKRFLKHLLAQHAVATWQTHILYIPTHVRGRRKATSAHKRMFLSQARPARFLLPQVRLAD